MCGDRITLQPCLPSQTVTETLSRPDATQSQQAIDDEITSNLMLGCGNLLKCHWESKRCLADWSVIASAVDTTKRFWWQVAIASIRAWTGDVCPCLLIPHAACCSGLAAAGAVSVRHSHNLSNGELEEEVFIRALTGAEHMAAGRARVLWLSQAQRARNDCLEGELRNWGFIQSDADPSLWIMRSVNVIVLSMFYVDDWLVGS
jgi:hypothetical protein